MRPTFQLLQFSPVPEFIDPVNIALVVNDGRTRVVYDKSFRRLHCVAPDFNTSALSYMLDYLESAASATDGQTVSDYVAGQSAQFRLTASRELDATPDHHVLHNLSELYLMALRADSSEPKSEGRGYIESSLNELLTAGVGVSQDILRKRARPNMFLRTKRAQNLFRSNPIAIKRVLDGSRGIVLIDGIDLSKGTWQHLGERTVSIAHAYFSFGKHRAAIEAAEKRTLHRAAIVFNMSLASQDSHSELYVRQLHNESDSLIDPADKESVQGLRKVCEDAIER